MHSADSGPKEKMLITINVPSVKIEFSSKHNPKVPEIASTKQIKAMMNDSDRNILYTSRTRAPMARKIPISFFFVEIDTEIKLNINKKANSARTRPAIRNAVPKVSANSINIVNCPI